MGYQRIPVDGIATGALLSGGVANTVVYSDSNAAFASLSTFSFNATYGMQGVGTATPAARFHASGAFSSPNAFGVTGVGVAVDAATWTDTISAGTVASVGVNTFGIPTLAASSASTYTNSATVYIAGATAAGANVTATNKYALWIGAGNIKLGVSDIVLDTVTGTTIGTAITQKLAFLGSAPVVQRASAAQAAVVTTATTQTTPFGFATGAQGDAIVTLVNELRAALVALGLVKGAA